MKIHKLILKLQGLEKEFGNVEVFHYSDEEGNDIYEPDVLPVEFRKNVSYVCIMPDGGAIPDYIKKLNLMI